MGYVGGKVHLAEWVRDCILRTTEWRDVYVEPFLGGAGSFGALAPYFQTLVASDIHPDLMLMWQAIAAGWRPPAHVSRAEYTRLRDAAPSALRGFVGFAASFHGKWLGGYAGRWATGPRTWRARMLALAPALSRTHLRCADYREVVVTPGMVIYADPPYADTTGFAAGPFDSAAFWATARSWAEAGAEVFVSEATAPAGWQIIAEREVSTTLGSVGSRRREAVFFAPGGHQPAHRAGLYAFIGAR